MSEQVIPEAFFDSLSIAEKLDTYLDGFTVREISLFSYFSSLLYGYRGNNVSDWGYKYIVDSAGYPFSEELNEAATRHIQNGSFDNRGEYYEITGRGTNDYNTFRIFDSFEWREEYIDAACSTNILVPYSEALGALLKAPDIKQSDHNTHWLDQTGVYEKIGEISQAVGVSAGDLIIPAVSWVKYLMIEEGSND